MKTSNFLSVCLATLCLSVSAQERVQSLTTTASRSMDLTPSTLTFGQAPAPTLLQASRSTKQCATKPSMVLELPSQAPQHTTSP